MMMMLLLTVMYKSNKTDPGGKLWKRLCTCAMRSVSRPAIQSVVCDSDRAIMGPHQHCAHLVAMARHVRESEAVAQTYAEVKQGAPTHAFNSAKLRLSSVRVVGARQ